MELDSVAYTDELHPSRLKPKAARLLGLESPDRPLQRRRTASITANSDHEPATDDQTMLLTPVSLHSGDGGAGVGAWAPDWPEPDDEYVEAMLHRRPQALPRRRGVREDPLTVWRHEATLLPLAGVPRAATNEWVRRCGLQFPLDPLFVVQWVAVVVLCTGYFVGARPLTHRALQDTGVPGVVRAASWLGPMVIVAALVGCLVTSVVDPRAPLGGGHRDLYFQQQWGIPAVDPETRMCRVCCMAAKPGTRHCKRCNKCVAGMDHHCRWLNTCIGGRNYGWFFATLCLAVLALTTVLIHAMYLVYLAGWHQQQFSVLVAGVLGNPIPVAVPLSVETRVPPPPPEVIAAICVLAGYLGLALGCLVFVGLLLVLHVRLCVLQTTTIEYEARREREKELRMQSGSEMIPLGPIHTQGSLAPNVSRPTLFRRIAAVSRKSAAAIRLFAIGMLRRRRDTPYHPVNPWTEHQPV
ncbi:hypothetical protein GGF46_003236 [Coemansia sp. RSA 552]|nr:hypothetical protein GGF46_003236 [Coemansia sp. RSA 552]